MVQPPTSIVVIVIHYAVSKLSEIHKATVQLKTVYCSLLNIVHLTKFVNLFRQCLTVTYVLKSNYVPFIFVKFAGNHRFFSHL